LPLNNVAMRSFLVLTLCGAGATSNSHGEELTKLLGVPRVSRTNCKLPVGSYAAASPITLPAGLTGTAAISWVRSVPVLSKEHCDKVFSKKLKATQSIGTHNSYHIIPSAGTLAATRALGLNAFADEMAYSHPTIETQLAMGLTSFEIDIVADPAGGLFSSPGVVNIGLQTQPSGWEVMSQPGFKVLHVQDIDILSHCLTLSSCLSKIDAHQRDRTFYIIIEVKTDTPKLPVGAPFQCTTALSMTDALWADLENAVYPLTRATPPVKFLIDNTAQSSAYIAYVNAKSIPTPVLLPSIADATTHPAGWSQSQVFVKCNDVTKATCALGKSAKKLAEEGYLVRARSDSHSNWNATKAALTVKSGVGVISTDHPEKLLCLQEVKALNAYACPTAVEG